MAYGLAWFSEFADIEENIFRVEILKRDFVGTAIKVLSGGNPIRLSWADDAASDPFYPMRTQKAEIQWISDDISGFDISDFFVVDHQEYKVRFGSVNTSNEAFSPLWEGYLVPTDCREPYQAKPYPVELSASCSLALLRDQYFLDANGRFAEGVQSLMDIVIKCLAQTELKLGIDVYLGLVEISGANPIALSQSYIDTDGLRGMKSFDVLEGILNSVNAYITQSNGRWVIRGIREQVAETITVRSFNHDGNGYTFKTVSQVSTIGRNPLSSEHSNLIPLFDVHESLAEPSSIITNAISVGIPVNRLRNGTFSPEKPAWGVNLGNMDGWTFSPEPKGWRLEGDGKPDNPYRFVIIGSVKTTGDIVYRTSGSDQKQTFIYDTPAITIHRDGGKDFYPNLKIVVSGAFRARDGGRLLIACRLNDGDRDYVTWLDESGNWTTKKKAIERSNIKVTVDTPHNPEEFVQLKDLPLQTFEVKSSKIPEYLNRPGGWIAKLYFSVYPITVGSDNFPEISNNFSPAVSLEDFSVSITTETAYEVEHYYQIDGKTLIKSGEDYSYTSIVADKINIQTAEQKRDENRVMTGYLTVGAFLIAKGWRRYVNGYETVAAHEPLQYLTLRERLRLLCGKRRVLEGPFYGQGLEPTDAVINLFDGGSDSYFTITGWAWDVKKRVYDLRIHQLDFTPLPDEVITLKKERNDNGRGNRLYQGASGSGSSGNGGDSSSTVTEEIEMAIPDPLYFTVGKTATQTIDIGPLIESSHTPPELQAKILYVPDWMLDPYEDRGPDGDLLTFDVTGTPVTKGRDQIIIELVGLQGEDYNLVIPVVVEKATSGASIIVNESDIIVGKVPGFMELPELWNFRTIIKGAHNRVVIRVWGGGPSGTEIDISTPVEIEMTNVGTYDAFIFAMTTLAGVFNYDVAAYRGELITFRETGKFTLYDEEYLAALSAELWDTTKDEILGVINPDGTSAFKKPASFDPKIIITGLPHTALKLTYSKDGVEVLVKEIPVNPAAEDAEYNLFDEIIAANAGKYDLLVDIENEDLAVYQRLVSWKIVAEEVKPQAGFDLITFNQNTINYTLIDNLPLINYQTDLPDNWGLSLPPVEVEYNNVDFKVFETTDGALVNFDIALRTNTPQSRAYLEGQEKEDILIFGLKDSVELGLHGAPRSFRAVAYFRDGETVVDIRQADFSFREPIGPEGYSGIRLITNDDSFNVTVIDPNVPKVGRKFALPELPMRYSLSVREIDGLLFDQVKVKYRKKVAGDYVTLFWLGSDYIKQFTSSTDVNELDSDLQANVIGILNVGGLRYLYAAGFAEHVIDEKGEYEASFIFYLDGAEIGVKSAEFEITDGQPEELPIKDCCGDDDSGPVELPIYEGVEGAWGGPTKTLVATLTENGTVEEIEEVDIELPGVDLTGPEWVLDKAPLISNTSTELNSAVTIAQMYSYLSSGSIPKPPVKTVVTSNMSLAGFPTVNGYAIQNGDRVLVQGMFGKQYNGPYVAAFGAWTRAADGDTGAELVGASYFVEKGALTGTVWTCINATPPAVGTDDIDIIQTQSNTNDQRWISLPFETSSINNLTNGGVKSYALAAGAPPNAPYGTIFTFAGNSSDGNSDTSGAWINQLIAGTDYNLYFRQRLTGTFGDTARVWTTLHFGDVDVTKWNIAYGYGNHNAMGYMFAANFNSSFDTRFSLKDTDDLDEGILNLYFKEQRVRNTPLTGLVNSIGIVTSADTILSALGKIEGRLQAIAAGGLNGSGTIGRFAKFTGANTVGNSALMYEAGNEIFLDGTIRANEIHNKAAASANLVAGISFWNGGALRWSNGKLGLENGDGSNVGSDYYISATSDFGNFLGHAFSISRATQIARFYQPVIGVSPTADNHLITRGFANATYSLIGHTHALSAITGASDVNAIELLTGAGVPKRLGENTWSLGLLSIYDVESLPGILNDKAAFNHTHSFGSLTGKPNSLLGYGIIDAEPSIAAGTAAQYWRGDKTWQTLPIPLDRFVSTPAETSNANFLVNGGVKGWANTGTNFISNYGTALTIVGHSATGNGASGGTYINQLQFGFDAEVGFRQSIDNWANWSSLYKFWTTKHFSQTNINNWNTAYGWGNPAGFGYITASSTNNLTNKSGSITMWDNNAGYITGITAAMINNALGYTAYNATANPNGFITASSTNNLTNKSGSISMWDNNVGYITTITNTAIIEALGYIPYNAANPNGFITASSIDNLTNKSGSITMWDNNAGYITNVLTWLGYTPYDASNPAGYITASSTNNLTNKSGSITMWDNNAGYITGSALAPYATISTTNDLQNQINGKIGTDKYIIINGIQKFLNNNPNFDISIGGGGNITGGGNNGYLTRWTGSTSIGNSRIIDSGSGEVTFNAGISATHMYIDNTLTAGSGYIGSLSSAIIQVTGRFTLPVSSEASLPANPPEGTVQYVNSGSGKGLWCYMGTSGWRLIATRLWVGGVFGGTSPP